MRLYNTLSKKVEEFRPVDGKRVKLFVCGPTVYDYSHIGHARTYLAYDALVKFMRVRLDWEITYVQNITDIEDKIIARAGEQNRDPLELAKELTQTHYTDMETLGIDSVDTYAPATQYIPEIISQIERLLAKKHAYTIEGDGVYFDVTTFADYGKLSGRTAEAAEDATSRIDESVNKKNKADFALWKFSKNGEPSWDAPFGAGRPGWHIEDTAIAEKHFGFKYDMHGGALELMFPHHEAEIAQMESLSGVSPMARLWVHTGLLTIKGKKMAKSVGNFITIRDSLAKDSAETLRMLVFSSLYRSPLDYTETTIQEACARQERLQEFWTKLKEVSEEAAPFPYSGFIEDFWKALEDDFNTPKAFASLFELAGEANKFLDAHKFSRKDAQSLLDSLESINGIFRILKSEGTVPDEIKGLVEAREEARKKGDFGEADRLRKEILAQGYVIDDTGKGTRIKKYKKDGHS